MMEVRYQAREREREREREGEREREMGTALDYFNDEQGNDISNGKRVFKDMKYIGKVNVPYFYGLFTIARDEFSAV